MWPSYYFLGLFIFGHNRQPFGKTANQVSNLHNSS